MLNDTICILLAIVIFAVVFSAIDPERVLPPEPRYPWWKSLGRKDPDK